MAPKIHPIFSQPLDNGTVGEFGVGEDGQAYWNGKPIVTQEKVVLQGWVSVAIIATAIAALTQAVFAGLGFADSHSQARQASQVVPQVATVTQDFALRVIATEEPCDIAGQMAYSYPEDLPLACIDGKWNKAPKCEKEGEMVFDMFGQRLTCKSGNWTPPLPPLFK